VRLYPLTVPNYVHIAMKRLKELIWYGMKSFRHTHKIAPLVSQHLLLQSLLYI